MKKKNSTYRLAAAFALFFSSSGALAQKCNTEGVLTFIGATFDLTRSVWLSTTTAGTFGLQVVNTKDIVDEWSLGAPGAHISVSPNLVLSNGGTHELLDLSDNNPCSLDVENQKANPIILPQFPTSRPVPPIGVVPPGDISGIMPELPVVRPPVDVITPEVPALRPPGVGITPEVPVVRPPGVGITPEIRPPGTGITPEVRPPGTGITPEVRPPGTGITPEIRPPGTGITPEVRPPGTGITPEVRPPGTGITPEVRPPGTGITPEVRPPGTGITPEVRPPGTGITPEVRPPGTGITPEVRPPGTGITPEVRPPGTGITPEVRPPGTGITPEVPVQRPPGEIITPERPITETRDSELDDALNDLTLSQRTQDNATFRWVVCIHPETGHRMTASYSGSQVSCPENYEGHWFEAEEFDKSGLPLSARYAGRLLPAYSQPQEIWRVWTEAGQTELRDRRGDRNFDSSESRITLGAHRAVGQRGIAGLSVGVSSFDSEGLRGFLQTDADKLSIGPYLGYQFGPALSLTSSINYSYTDTDISLANFRGGNKVDEWLFNIGLEGFQRWGNWGFLPRMHFNYSWFETTDSNLSGELLGKPLALNLRDTSGHISYLESSLTIMRGFKLGDKGMLTPYLELGATMAFDLQNDVQVARGITSGGYQAIENFSGLARLGTRWVMSPRNYLDLEVSQESIDADGLEIWQARLYFLHAF